MALLTLPAISKGVAASVSLNKTDLFALAAVATDSWFSNSANVKRCIIEYNSTVGNQRRILDFDLSVASPVATFLISEKARDNFRLERLVLEDQDGDVLVLERSQLPSGLDISVYVPSTSDPNTTILIHFDGNLTESASGLMATTLGSTPIYENSDLFNQAVVANNTAIAYQTTNQCDFGTNDMTIEFRIKSVYAGGVIFYLGAFAQSGGFMLRKAGDEMLFQAVAQNGDLYNIFYSGAIPNNSWCHVAIVRQSGVFRLFVNGLERSGLNQPPSNVALGSQNKPFYVMAEIRNGLVENPLQSTSLDELRISKVARYTANFTPPTAQLT